MTWKRYVYAGRISKTGGTQCLRYGCYDMCTLRHRLHLLPVRLGAHGYRIPSASVGMLEASCWPVESCHLCAESLMRENCANIFKTTKQRLLFTNSHWLYTSGKLARVIPTSSLPFTTYQHYIETFGQNDNTIFYCKRITATTLETTDPSQQQCDSNNSLNSSLSAI